MDTKKYIFIVQVTRQLSIDIVNRFVSEGAEVELITGVIETNYAPLDDRVNVTLLNTYDNRTTFKRMFTWSIFTFLSFFYVLFKSKKKELIIITTPPFVVFLGSFFFWFRKQNYHLIIWDLYPDVMVNFGVVKENSAIIKVWKKWNRICFNNAKNVFTLGRHLMDAVKEYTNKEVIIIPNWVNTDFVKPIENKDNPFVKKHSLVDKFIVMYSGNLGLTHNIEAIVETAEILKNNHDIQFLIIGEGAKKSKIEKMVSTKKLNNVLVLPYQDKDVLPYSLGCADVGVVTLSEGAEMISVPSKTYYTLAAGSLILALASKESELGILIEDHECGIVFENSDPTKVADFITDLLNNKEQLKVKKNNARQASLSYTPENAKRYYDYICSN